MSNNITIKRSYLKLMLLIVCVLFSFKSESQTKDKVSSAYAKYSKLPREIAYAHVNKSLYLKDERIGFSVYVFDKSSKNHSDVTTNVYCSIENDTGTVLNKALLLAENGVAHGQFLIDSTYTSGNYTFKAYTNWMKNFDEQNLYVQSIKVINTDQDNSVSEQMDTPKIDTQFLPEGGHLIANVKNVVGVIIKNNNGYGFKEAEGVIKNGNGERITNFKTNQFGIGKFIFTPEEGKNYTAEITYDDLKSVVNLKPAERNGINLSLNNLGPKIALTFRSNANTLKRISGKNYRILIHNGSVTKSLNINFTNSQEITKLINTNDLFSGMNIITLFDDANNPILERLFFNYDGIALVTSETPTVNKIVDSISISIPFKGINLTDFHNISVSVLPSGTTSYETNHNILSYIYLQPYVKGYIENARYYFTAIDRKKKFELDNLLLTQGWSSYKWNAIFNYEPNIKFDFEKGITVNASINKSKSNQFIMYPLTNSTIQTIDVPKKENTFRVQGLLPIDDEKVVFGSLNKQQNVEKPNLYAQFSPSEIPSIDNFIKIPPLKVKSIYDSKIEESIFKNSISDAQELDLIIINAEKEKTRIDEIERRQTTGNIDIFDENARNRYIDFASYISNKGFNVSQSANSLNITTQRRNTLNGGRTPLIYYDKLLLSDFSVLLNLDMRNVDYIVVDKSGLGEGIRGAAGVIKIFTNPQLKFDNDLQKNLLQEILIPLTFTSSKTFYTPLYSGYRSDFFNQYGVIDWISDGKIDTNGHLNFQIANKGIEQIKLFIEGTANKGSFISEEKIITFN